MSDIVAELRRKERLARLRRSSNRPPPQRTQPVRSNGQLVECFGERKTVPQWFKDERCGAPSEAAIWNRLSRGWVPELAVTEPARQPSSAETIEEVDLSVILDIMNDVLSARSRWIQRLKNEGKWCPELAVVLDPSIPTEAFCGN